MTDLGIVFPLSAPLAWAIIQRKLTIQLLRQDDIVLLEGLICAHTIVLSFYASLVGESRLCFLD